MAGFLLKGGGEALLVVNVKHMCRECKLEVRL